MADYSSETLIANERLKAISSVLCNLGAALTAAAAARWFVEGPDLYTASWIVGAIALIWAGQHILTLLEKESPNG